MATRTGVLTKDEAGIVTASWTGLLHGDLDDGSPINVGAVDGLTCQLAGTLGTGGAVTMQGSNDGGTSWGTLQDPAGTDIVMDALGEMFVIAGRPGLIRPLITAGDGTTDLDVHIVGMRR